MFFFVIEKDNQNSLKKSRTYDLSISSSDALALSYRRIVRACVRAKNVTDQVHGTNILNTAEYI